jgi:UDP-galactopyranose mutase
MENKQYDWLVVGAGLAGAVFVDQMKGLGKRCLVIDKRSTIGGNCYTEKRDGIPVHVWGSHIFHTNSLKVWKWISSKTEFNNYHHQVKCNYDDKLYTFPINLSTLHELDPSITTPQRAKDYLSQFKEQFSHLTEDNLENHCLKQVGKDIYEIFIKEYTEKQWGTSANLLPSRIIKRIPVRTNFDSTYFLNAKWEGIPVNGYTEIFDKCFEGVEVILGKDYLSNKETWDSMAHNVLYTGPLDAYFNWDMGELEWRSLEFDHKRLENVEDYQGVSVINYTQAKYPFTRIIEHKHFVNASSPHTWITHEYPQKWDRSKEPYYPIADEKNNELHKQYVERFKQTGKVFAGRLADYKYYDMDQVIGSTLSLVENITSK